MELSSLLASSFLCGLFILSSALSNEGLALLSFKTSILKDPSGSLANWNSSDQDPCHWNGITCKQSAVVSFSLPKNALLGSLPASLGSLTSLRHVNLRSNHLSGSLPPALLRTRSLQSLVLYGNSLSGSLPSEVGTLSSLQILDLSHNSMNGSIPVSIVHCRRLRTLVLGHNSFTGSLPFGMGTRLSALEMIDVSHNRLSGPIPGDIGSLRSLESIADLSHNLFSGPVPESIGNLPERVYVDLSYNNLSGPIPQDGSLVNRGLNAFVGNPGLCGPPLKSPCGSANASIVRNGESVRMVAIGLIVSDVIVIGLLALAFYYLYRITILVKGVDKQQKSNKRLKRSNGGLCLGKDELESSVLVPLDKNVRFGLEELLQSSASVLGKSSTGIVYKVVMDDGRTLAVRRFGEGGQRKFKEFKVEVEAIGKVRHANIVALRAYYWSIDEKLLVYDYIPNGNLTIALHGRSGGSLSPMSWRVRLQIISGIANGLAFLHGFSQKRYVHGDLKPSNILLDLKMEPYISNFRLGQLAWLAEVNTPERSYSQFSDSAVSPVTSGRPYYQPHEAFRTLKPSQKWDVYSYGVILLEIISGRSPEVLLDTMEMDLVQWFQFCIEERKPTFDVFDPCLAQEPDMEDEIIVVLKVALACVQSDPERRPSMRHVKDTLERSLTRK